MSRKLNPKERELFLNIALPDLKGKASEEAKGRLLYSLKTGKLNDNDLAAVFPQDYHQISEMLETKPRFSIFKKPNYIYEYFFTVHNKKHDTKVLPAKIIGFKAERRAGKQYMQAKVRHYDSKIEDSSLRVFENIELKNMNLQDHVLIHNNTVCQIISEKDYNNIIQKYFQVQ